MIPDEKLKSILEEVARYFNFKSWTYTHMQLNETIENYFGVLIPITINKIGENGEEKRSIFVKIPPIEPPGPLKPVIRQHYEVEIYTYSTLVPIYRSITTVDTSKLIPECYHASLEKNNEVLVLQDMTCSGYRKFAEKMLFDFEHVVLSLKALAKFHCLSMVLKEKGFDFDVDVMKPYTSLHPEMYYTYIKDSLVRNMHLFNDSKYQVYLKSLLENLASHIETSTSKASYLVYGHGDFWRENILFQYENDKPIKACLLDFQKSRIMSPAQDILLFLLGSIEAALNRKHHQYFLDVYLAELHRNLEENSLNKIYSMGNLVRDMRIVGPYTIAISTMSYSLWLGLEDGGVVKSKNTCDSDDRKQTMSRFKTKVVDMLEDLVCYKKLSANVLPVKLFKKALAIAVIIPILSTSSVVITHVTMVDFKVMQVIPYIFLEILTYILGGYWYLLCESLSVCASVLAEDFQRALRHIGPAGKVAEYRALWLRLSKLARNTGIANCYTFTFVNLYLFLIITLSIYGLLSQISQGFGIKDIGLAVTACCSIFLLFFICDEAHYASQNVRTNFQKKLLMVELSWMNTDAQTEVNMFLRATEMNPSQISLGGFFDVNRNLFKSLLATMVTYLVVLLQFQISIPDDTNTDQMENEDRPYINR